MTFLLNGISVADSTHSATESPAEDVGGLMLINDGYLSFTPSLSLYLTANSIYRLTLEHPRPRS